MNSNNILKLEGGLLQLHGEKRPFDISLIKFESSSILIFDFNE